MADAPFVWGEGGEQLTPGQLTSRRRIADAMMAQGMDGSPIRSRWQGVDRLAKSLFGGLESRDIDRQEAEGRQAAISQLMSAFGGGQGTGAPVAAAGPPAAVPAASGPAAAPAVADTTGKIYEANEPSPLDPPSGADRDNAIRTVMAEAGNQGPTGMQAVASVIRNRAVDGGYGGDTPTGVVTAPSQFEPWGTEAGRAKMAAIDPNSPQYKAASGALERAYFGDDPTEGKTLFYSPKVQAALGRPAPPWAKGEGQAIGDHVFFDDQDGALPPKAMPAQGTGLPAGVPAVSPAVATVAQAMPQANAAPTAARPGVAQLMAAMNNPFLPPQMAQLAAAQAGQLMKPRETHSQETDKAGNIWDVNQMTGQRTVALKKDKDESPPTSVLEYNYYKSQLPPGSQPMDYGSWSTAKARAGATTITNTIGGEKKGLEEASKLDAESVRKGQNELMPALEDADHNFQLMQAAIERNGGKLPTGGELGKLGLDWARTKDYIKDNWGVDLGSDPTKTTSLETFNKGGIKAAGDMAKAIGGNRVLKVEFDMAQRANPGLETSDGGNKYLLDVNRNGIAAKRDYLQAQEDYWRANNHSLDGFQKTWNAEIKANPRPLSSYSVAPAVPQEDGSQFVKLPSTAQGGYSWFRKGDQGFEPIKDKTMSDRLEASAQPLKPAAPAPTEKKIGDKTYQKIDGNWFEKPSG